MGLLRRRAPSPVADHRKAEPPIDADEHTRRVIKAIADYTLTTHDRVIALVDAVRHVFFPEEARALDDLAAGLGVLAFPLDAPPER